MDNRHEKRNKRLVFDAFLIGIFGLILLRFFYLQIVRKEHYLGESERNRIREIVVQPTRGLVFDRYGNLLVDNAPAYSVFGIPYDLRKSDSVYFFLSQTLEISREELIEKIEKSPRGLFQPVKLKRDIDFKALSAIEESKLELPGVEYYIEPRRYYPSNVRASHILGYIGEISRQELARLESKGYQPGDIIGKAGIERAYEDVLKGVKGIYYTEVDAIGRKIRTLEETGAIPPVPGNNIFLTLDASLQACVESEMVDKRGGVIVIDVTNGEILAIVSKPDYDLEFFSKPLSPNDWSQMATHSEHPLFHRMIQSVYPPGSTFKLILAGAALEAQKVNLKWTVDCPGFKWVRGQLFECWKTEGHGEVALLEAIAQSCNVYFYNLMLRVGLGTWSDFCHKLGFGSLTGIDLIGESSGLVPDQNFMDQKYGKNLWAEGQLCNLAIGQGDVLVTPLQMTVLAAIVANEGTYHRPHIVKGIQDVNSGKLEAKTSRPHRTEGISPQTFQLLKKGMYLAVHSEHGTAVGLAYSGVAVAGKTGTAQNPHGEDHAWFIGFAPYLQPQIAFCIFIENGGSGSRSAVPIARKIVQYYFQNFASMELQR